MVSMYIGFDGSVFVRYQFEMVHFALPYGCIVPDKRGITQSCNSWCVQCLSSEFCGCFQC